MRRRRLKAGTTGRPASRQAGTSLASDLWEEPFVPESVRPATCAAAVCLVLILGGCSYGQQAGSTLPARFDPDARPLVGITWGPRITWAMKGGTLARLDPGFFRALPRTSIELGKYGYSWSFSPDRSKLVLGGFAAGLRFADVRRMQILSDLKLGRPAGLVVAVAWPDSRHVHAVIQSPFGQGKLSLAIVDAAAGRVLAERRLADTSDIVQVGRARGVLVLLLAPPSRIGPSRLVAVDESGSGSSVTLSGIQAGWEPPQAGSALPVSRQWTPGLAVDPLGRRALVVGGGTTVAEVDLRSLDVAYHDLTEEVSLLSRFRNWLEPVAKAKGETEGPVREARWLGDGVVAVSGFDARGERPSRAAGLRLIDTRKWIVRDVDEQAAAFALARGVILAYGCCFRTGGKGLGLTAYDLEGRRLWHLFGRTPIHAVQTTDGRAYVRLQVAARPRIAVVDVRAGKIIRRVETSWVQLLLPHESSMGEKEG